jgi:transcriptional regulator with XRE-family HTH domain
METLGQLPKKKALTMQELANRTGEAIQTVWRLEHGIGKPLPRTRGQIAYEPGVEPWEIASPKGRSKGT